MQYTASTTYRTALPRSKRRRQGTTAQATAASATAMSSEGEKLWASETDPDTNETEVATANPIKIVNRLRITDENGTTYGTISLDANGRFYFDKGIISAEDVVAYGIRSTDVQTVTDLINSIIDAKGTGSGTIDAVEVTGTGNAISSATLSADGKKITLTKGITALTAHQSLTVKRYNYATASDVSIKQDIYTLGAVNHLNWGSNNNALIDKAALAYWNGRYNSTSSNLLYFKNGEIDSVSARNTAITDAINELDVASIGGSGKYIQSISQTDGKISATEATLNKSAVGLGNVDNTSDYTKKLAFGMIQKGVTFGNGNSNRWYRVGYSKVTQAGWANRKVILCTYETVQNGYVNIIELHHRQTNSTSYGPSYSQRTLLASRPDWAKVREYTTTEDGKTVYYIEIWACSPYSGTDHKGANTFVLNQGSGDYQNDRTQVEVFTITNDMLSASVPVTEGVHTTYSAGAIIDKCNKLQTARTLWGNSFDGSGNITGDITVGAQGRMVITQSSITCQEKPGYAGDGWRINTLFSGSDDSNKLQVDVTGTGSADPVWNNAITIKCLSGNVGIGTDNPTYKLHVNGTIRGNGLAMFDGVDVNNNSITRINELSFKGATTKMNFLKSGDTTVSQVASMGYDGSGQYVQFGTSSTSGNTRLNLLNNKGQNRLMLGTNGNAYLSTAWEDDTAWSANNVYLMNNNSGYTMIASTTTRNSATASRKIYLRPEGLTVSTNETTLDATGVNIKGNSANTLVIKRTATNSGAFVNYHCNNQTANGWRVGMNSSNNFAFLYSTDTMTTTPTLVTIGTDGKITTSGNISTETTSTSDKYVIAKNSNGEVRLYTSTNRGLYDATLSKWIIHSIKADSTVGINAGKVIVDNSGNIVAQGDVTAYSDRRLKSNITDLDDRGFLRPVEYDKDGRHSIGFVAQEVRDLYPEVVAGDEKEGFLSVNYGAITAILQAQIIEQQKQINEQQNQINELYKLLNKVK